MKFRITMYLLLALFIFSCSKEKLGSKTHLIGSWVMQDYSKDKLDLVRVDSNTERHIDYLFKEDKSCRIFETCGEGCCSWFSDGNWVLNEDIISITFSEYYSKQIEIISISENNLVVKNR